MSVFDQLSGQKRAAAVLEAAASMPGDAYLFTGPPGVGKAESARAFAAAIVSDGCGNCSVCRRVVAGLHPDVQIFHPEGLTYPIELIREMAASSARTPLEAARRVMIVEEADRIVERSQNALLKALEEPNRSVTWVLVAGAIDTLLPTMLSRCRIVEFAAVPEKAVASLLRSRFDLDPASTEVILRAARGDLERARALAQDERVRGLRNLAIDFSLAGGVSPRWAIAVAEEVREAAAEARAVEEKTQAAELGALEENLGTAGGWRKRAVDRNRRILRKVENDVFTEFLAWIAAAFRDLAAASAGSESSGLTNQDRSGEILAAARQRPTWVWLEMCQTALDGQLAIVENANPPLVVESVFLRLVTLSSAAGVAQG